MNSSAKDFLYSEYVVKKGLKVILAKIYTCYNLMCEDFSKADKKLSNDENLIRNELHYNYLNKPAIRKQLKLQKYIFIPEVSESHTKDRVRGRTDIRVLMKSSFDDPENYYYTIECKRLDGDADLNRLYVLKGVKRFVDTSIPLYKSYFGENGMIGFVVKKLNINTNVNSINKYIANKHSYLGQIAPCPNKTISTLYKSEHTYNEKPLSLYHLMLDVSDLVD